MDIVRRNSVTVTGGQGPAAGLAPERIGAIHALTGLLDTFGDGLDDDTALLALGVPAPDTHTETG
ncbi:hypothetical protein [Streptomyces sediminimaris]|uniref:hypothetical protein n=1 Tax=Streptomyces sediminimaris TaxID=3383721 RepID=UPI00399C2F35